MGSVYGKVAGNFGFAGVHVNNPVEWLHSGARTPLVQLNLRELFQTYVHTDMETLSLEEGVSKDENDENTNVEVTDEATELDELD